MYKYFTIITVILQTVVNITADNQTREIETLEREKGDLFKQINDAIDESVSLLKNGNDSEAHLGVEYMQKLKEQLREINRTDDQELIPDTDANDTRRAKKKFNLDFLQIANVYQKNKLSKTKQEKKENKLVIKKKIEEWLQQREMEKQKIREYRQRLKKNTMFEDCPRFGVGSKKSRAAGGSRRKRKLPRYPCCRKCCKKSYMGCL